MSWRADEGYQDANVAATYDVARFSSLSGRFGDYKERRSFNQALDRAQNARSVLDVPCGTGRMTLELARRGLHTFGLDISLEMIAQAEPKLKSHETACGLVRGNILEMPFPPDSFDVVTCVRLFGHYPAEVRVAILREMARVSRHYVIVQYFCETALTRLKRWVKRSIVRTYAGVGYPVTEARIGDELRQSGLEEVRRFWCQRYYSEEVFVLASTPKGGGR